MKSWLDENNIEMYSMHNEEEFFIAEKFSRTFKNKIYKYMASISKNLYIDKIDDVVNKYNNTYVNKIKVKPVDIIVSTYIDPSKQINDKGPKFKIRNIVRISKYKNIFAEDFASNWLEEVFVVKKAKNTVLGICVINNLKSKEIL